MHANERMCFFHRMQPCRLSQSFAYERATAQPTSLCMYIKRQPSMQLYKVCNVCNVCRTVPRGKNHAADINHACVIQPYVCWPSVPVQELVGRHVAPRLAEALAVRLWTFRLLFPCMDVVASSPPFASPYLVMPAGIVRNLFTLHRQRL